MVIRIVDDDEEPVVCDDRITAIITWILNHSERISQLRTGSVELHFGEERISAKIVEHETVK